MKFLVINFNRYDTHKSTREYFDAPNVENVIHQIAMKDGNDDGCEEYLLSMLEKVDEVFSCIAEEESDILIYVI